MEKLVENFRKAVKEALPEYCERFDFADKDSELECFLYDFVDAGDDDLFNTRELRAELVNMAFPNVDWKGEHLPEPLYKSPEMEAMDEAIDDFDKIMQGVINPKLC